MKINPINLNTPDAETVARLISECPRRGNGLNAWLFKTAIQLRHAVTPEQAIKFLYGLTRLDRVPEREIARIVGCAYNRDTTSTTIESPRWPALDVQNRNAILEKLKGFTASHFEKISPVPLSDLTAQKVIEALFPGDPLLCCGWNAFQFQTDYKSEWLPYVNEAQFIVPSAMLAVKGTTKDGRESDHTLANTGPRQYLVIEQDNGTPEEQAAILCHLAQRAPFVLAVHSGKKSIHGWFPVADGTEETMLELMRYAVSLGADRATWTRSQFVRMPGGTRDESTPQRILYFNPKTLKPNQN